jgi:NhaP-type Na+/H+ or K+/H+ antiporter
MIAFFAKRTRVIIVDIAQDFLLIVLPFGAALVAKVLSPYPILAATNRFTRKRIPMVWRHIVLLRGMRGAISVALVASLPKDNFKNTIATIIFGVVWCH